MGDLTGLAKEQQRALGRLKAIPELKNFYLAGGSAIGVHLNHRRSVDLDLFSLSPEIDLDALARHARSLLPDLRVLGITEASLRLVVDGVPIDLVRYPYAPLERPTPGPLGFPVAGLRDLAAMKLAAIARRGLRRDFWDLYAILQTGMTLRDAADAYLARFGLGEPDLYHVMRALTYFDDAERDPVLPQGLTLEAWERFKAFFLAEAPSLLLPR